MTNETPDNTTPEPERPDEPAGADRAPDNTEAPRPTFGSALRGLRRAASEVAHAGTEEARKLAETARPEVERRARQAKAAAEAARPHLEQKARDATGYVREHQDEIVSASKRGAEVAASTAARAVTPGPLRPAVDAMQHELRKPAADDDASADETDPAGTDGPSDATPRTE